MEYKISKYLIFSDILDDTQEDKKIAYSTRTGKAVLLSDYVYDMIHKFKFSELEAPMLQLLFEMEILVPSQENEFETILTQNIVAQEDNSSLSFVIQPTANCQLGCHYCGQSHFKHTMADDLLPKIMQRIEDMSTQKKYDSLGITWFGESL